MYESLLHALDGRGDVIEGVAFWDWEHEARRHMRTLPNMVDIDASALFAIWPEDDGGGEAVTRFLRTRDMVLEGDFNGDGRTDVARYFAESGNFHVSLSTTNGFQPEAYWGTILETIDWTHISVSYTHLTLPTICSV